MDKFTIGGIAMMGALAAVAAVPVETTPDKVAVVYFSYSGNTETAAKKIASALGAGLFEIKAVKAYPSDYMDCCNEAKGECYGKRLREIEPMAIDLSKYDVVLVGTPNWWGTMAPPVRTWVTQNAAALSSCKAVSLFATHGGGGMQRIAKEFSELLPEASILPPQAFPGSSIGSAGGALESYATSRVKVK